MLVESRDLYTFGLEDDAVESRVGNRTSVGYCDHAGAAAGMEMVLDAITKKIRSVAAATRFDAFSKKGKKIVEGFAGEIAVRIGTAEDVEERVFFPGFGPTGSNYLLHKDVGGLRRNL